MTRRRAFGLIFGLLIVVYLISATVTIALVRDRLEDAVDRDLHSSVSGAKAVLATMQIDEALQINLSENANAITIIDGREEVAFVPAGSATQPRPRPDVSASMIVSRVDRPFTVDSTEGGPGYRVLSARLDDGRYVAVAQPLDSLRSVLVTLQLSLLVTLFAVVAVLGVAFWLILRASLRPYDDMIDTAEAIARGELDRRATATAGGPEVEQLAESLNTMLDQIQGSFQAKEHAEARLKEFLADVSHELRTPLTTIRGYSEVYLSGAATDVGAVETQMTRINAEAARMGRLVDDLLTLARLGDARPVEAVPVDLRAIVDDAVSDARTSGPDHRVVSEIGLRKTLVLGDADSLRQLVGNLLMNALKHTPQGTEIVVTLDTSAQMVTLSVADNGPGIDPERAAHVFDRFYRSPASGEPRADGSGLGLAIVAAVVSAHSGTIEVAANRPHGTVFTVSLPRVVS